MSDAALAPPSTAATSTGPGVLWNINSALSSGLPLWERGPVALRPHGAYSFSHQTGMLRRPGEPLDTNRQSLSVGSALELGQHWRGDYTADWVSYSNAAFQDGVDHSASLAGSYGYLNWTFGASGSYRLDHPSLVETGYQTRQQTLGTTVSAHGMVGQRSFVDLSVSQSNRKADAVTFTGESSDVRDWSVNGALGQQFTPKLSASAGVTVGWATQSLGPDMTYTRPQLQANWTPTDKIAVGAMAGWEQRRFRDSTAGTFTSPVYSGSVTYHPLDTTSFTAGITQGVAPSYVGSAVTRSTGWNVGLQQRLLQILYANVGYSRQRSRYYETVRGLPQARSDTYNTINGSLAVRFLEHGSASVFYQRTQNSSNQLGYRFTSTTYGVQVGFSF